METLIRPWRIFPKQIDAVCYNRGRLALLRLEHPLRVTLQQHRGLEVILDTTEWLCVDSNDEDRPVLAWREFKTHGRNNLHQPVACELWLYHSCAGLIMGSALDDLSTALETLTIDLR
ncbi:hypothetical protein [Nitrosomonas supralitoralis]|uniref:Uncharacterized protein n=1 Tax=Nitrosomonas supralitoralis TaxID=2116706 RepID=A0A2P7NT17_9PROT|nr:hypothetical protein [Nitrosomonas supralitoralis]PSJ16614.1 hypothetical protein C7H79_12485 [Nitrosomonas supralitoralis]